MFQDVIYVVSITCFIENEKSQKAMLIRSPCTVRVSEKTWQVIVQTSRP